MTLARCRWTLRIVQIALGRANDHCFEQSLLDRSSYFRLRENVGGGLRKMARRFVQSQQAVRDGCKGPTNRGNEGGASGRPMMALLAAARSSGVSDMVPHPQAAEDRR
jgi:hypothetical protein